MSHFLDRLSYFAQPRETFSQGHGQTNGEDRTWEDAYRAKPTDGAPHPACRAPLQ